ncbi:MAG: response regulator [Chloroflexi bacterium]|nr:response regulator [Chloroflexota bacterium]
MPTRQSPWQSRGLAVATLLVSCVVLNVLVGQLVRNVFKLPIFLDSIGTILTGALMGPLAGAAVGAASNVLAGVLLDDPGIIPYALTAACIGVAAGLATTLGAFRSLPGVILAGLFTGVLAALVSAPITAYVQQATSSPGQVALVGVFASTGENLLKAVTLEGFVADPLDKAISFTIVYFVLRLLPAEIVEPLAEARAFSRSRQLSARYGVAAALSVVALLFAWVFRPVFGTPVYAIFYLAVIISAWYGGLGPAILAGVVGLLANIVIQLPPVGPGLGIDDWLRVAIYVSVASLIALITDRLERTNAALEVSLKEQREQEAQTRAVVNGVVEALVLVDPNNHRLLSVNHQFEEMFGVSGSQVVGQTLRDLNTLVDRAFAQPDELRQRVTDTASDATAQFTEILQQVWPQERALQLFSAPVLTDGRFLGRLYGFRDVTQERELDRMKTEFVSQVSHELRTPLTAIKGFTELLLDGDAGEVNDEQQEYLDIVKSNVDRLVALINDLLDISRIESGRIKLDLAPIDLAAIITSVVATMRPLLDAKQQTLTTSVEADLPLAMGDRDRVVQVVTNLVSNAHKYTQAEGAITVSAERTDNLLRVAVQDNGMGIPADDIPKLFTRFFRVDSSLTREIGGTGLGLSIVKSIVELQGGTVSVESEVGRGSTFAFTLPIAGAEAPAIAPRVSVPPEGTVLVVENEPDIREQLESSLMRAGYTVRLADDIADAISQMDQQRPDLVMLRLRLTAPRGFEDARALAETTEARDIPLLVVSIQRDASEAVQTAIGSTRLNEFQVVTHVRQALEKSGARRVLIIDDDSDTRRLLSIGLQNHGFEPVEAADGESGIAAAFAQSPDLVLLDLHLPGADGFSVLQQLKRSPATAQIPVIVVTGDEDLWLGARARVLALGAADFVAKPFEMDTLIGEMRTLLPQKEASHVDTSSGR